MMAKKKVFSDEEIPAIIEQIDVDEDVITVEEVNFDWNDDDPLEITEITTAIVDTPNTNASVRDNVRINNDHTDDSDGNISDDVSAGAEENYPFRRKKMLVNSLAMALDESNYDAVPQPDNEIIMTSMYQKKTKNIAERKITWSNIQPQRTAENSSEKIVVVQPPVIPKLTVCMTPIDCWECFISNDMLELVVLCTNKRIVIEIDRHELDPDNMPLFKHVKLTDLVEIKCFIGLLYYRGLLTNNHIDYDVLFTEQFGPAPFGASMSAKRFGFLHSHISFDDCATRAERWRHDRFAPFREIFEKFNDACSSSLIPREYLALDETLYPCRNRMGFKQNNKSQPAKYGLLYKSVNSVVYPYTYRTAVYAGKPTGEPGPYYIPGIIPLVKSLIIQLSEKVSLRGRNLTIDRQYSSIELFEFLWSMRITAIGTILLNRRGLPRQFFSVEGRHNNSYDVAWECAEKKLSLHSYVANTKSSGRKNVMLLSTATPLMAVTKDDEKKPAIMKLYDFTKGGTDIVDHRINKYTTNTKSNKWTLSAFSYVLDTARVNAQTIFSLNNKKHPRETMSFNFGMELAKTLIEPNVKRRDKTFLARPQKIKIDTFLGHTQCVPYAYGNELYPQRGKRRACSSCVDEFAPEFRTDQHAKVSRTTQQCQRCENSTCHSHLVQQCSTCYQAVSHA